MYMKFFNYTQTHENLLKIFRGKIRVFSDFDNALSGKRNEIFQNLVYQFVHLVVIVKVGCFEKTVGDDQTDGEGVVSHGGA